MTNHDKEILKIMRDYLNGMIDFQTAFNKCKEKEEIKNESK